MTPLKLYIASDHAGFELKEILVKKSEVLGIQIEWIDLGCFSKDSVDYPNFAQILVEKVLHDQKVEKLTFEPRGILICGSGVGMSIGANRFEGIRAVLALRPDVAKLSRQHNASNVLCLGSRILTLIEAEYIIEQWLRTPFEGGRHQVRTELLDNYRAKNKKGIQS